MPKYTLKKDKETKNTVRYSNPAIGSIYLPNMITEELGTPAYIEVTIEAGNP